MIYKKNNRDFPENMSQFTLNRIKKVNASLMMQLEGCTPIYMYIYMYMYNIMYMHMYMYGVPFVSKVTISLEFVNQGLDLQMQVLIYKSWC